MNGTGVAAPGPDSNSLVARLEARATRVATPCGDGNIVWHVWGDEAAEPVVLFHGGSGSWTHWVRTIEPLVAAGRRVWAADLPGFGDSDAAPGGEDADSMPEPLEAGLAQIFGNTSVDLVGFSFGGLVAGLLAAAYPTRARKVVLVGAPGLGVVSQRLATLRGWRHIESAAERDVIHRHNIRVLMLHAAEIDDGTLALHRHNVTRDRLPRRRLPHTRALAIALPHVLCPVHAIYGDNDAIYEGRHEALETTLAESAPTLVDLKWIADAGHWVQYEQPVEFFAALAAALHISQGNR